jgi:dihydroxyacetone kinase-like protein
VSADRRPEGPQQNQRTAAARAAGLIAVAEDLAGEFSLRPLLERILLRCTELLGCHAGSICSVDEAAGTYRKEADIGVACQSGRVFPLTEGMTGVVVARRAPVWFDRYDQVHGGHVASEERATLRGVIGVPLEWRYVPEYNLIMRTDAPRDDKVSVIQGSGSGHEPAHVMIVGKGMLDAACPGDVFSAPPMDYVLETSKLLASPKGVLHIVNNYTGDRMAFEMGQEMAEADGITVGTLVVDDDVAVKDSTYTVGRRGVAGNFFVIKAVGAASEQGADLEELLRIGNKVNSVTRTMGMALTSCTPPAKGSPLFDLGDDEMEMGVGIHGEPGRRREKLASANEIVDELLEAVVSDLPFSQGDDVAVMVNGLGGTPISELYLLYGYTHEQLAKRGINVRRNYVGNYCTSLDMAGTSITLSRLDDEIADLLAAPAEIAIRTF